MNDQIVLCENCAHFLEDRCRRTGLRMDYVHGRHYHRGADYERLDDSAGACGPKAIHFMPKPPPTSGDPF